MATELTSRAQGQQKAGARGYEQRDASASWIFGIVIFMAFAGVMIHLILGGVLDYLTRSRAPTDAFRPIRKLVQSPRASFPRLQISARMDLAQFRALEDEQLTNYGWIDRTSGIVRVPIDRAMELVLQKGLPVRTNSDSHAGPSPADLIQQRSLHREPEVQEVR